MRKLWEGLKVWWENRKEVIKDWARPQLDRAFYPLTSYLISRGIKEELAKDVAIESIIWIKAYLERQL